MAMNWKPIALGMKNHANKAQRAGVGQEEGQDDGGALLGGAYVGVFFFFCILDKGISMFCWILILSNE